LGSVVTIGDAAPVLQTAEHDLDAVAAPVAALVVSDRSLRDLRPGMQGWMWALANVAAPARKRRSFLLSLADSGRAGLLVLNDNVLAIMRARLQS
jgi:hypothetical protein